MKKQFIAGAAAGATLLLVVACIFGAGSFVPGSTSSGWPGTPSSYGPGTPGFPQVYNQTTGSQLTDVNAENGYPSFGGAVLTASSATTLNLSVSPGTCTLAGSGSVLGTSVSGTNYTFATGGTLTNGSPTYTGTNGLDVWTLPSGNWVVTASASLGVSTSSSLTGSAGALAGNVFSVSSGSSVLGCTGSTGTALVSSGVSVPCHALIVSTTGSGCLVSTNTAAGTFPLPANTPLRLQVNNVDALWVTGGTSLVGYLYY